MDIQSIQLFSKTERTLQAGFLTSTSTTSPTTSSSSKSSWRKFASDTTTYRYESSRESGDWFEDGLVLLDAQKPEQYAKLLSELEQFMEEQWPVVDGLVYAIATALKSKCYEGMGQLELSLIEMEKALKKIVSTETGFDQLIKKYEVPDPRPYLQLRQAALWLHLGKEQEALEVFRANQPNTVAATLLYRLMEQKSGTALLSKGEPVTDERDVEELFFAARYEEVLKLTENQHGDPSVRLRAAALAMLGRTQEAVDLLSDLRHNPWFDDSTRSSEEWIIRALNKEDLAPFPNDLQHELEAFLPIALVTNWVRS